jgi:hypothetical protein
VGLSLKARGSELSGESLEEVEVINLGEYIPE